MKNKVILITFLNLFMNFYISCKRLLLVMNVIFNQFDRYLDAYVESDSNYRYDYEHYRAVSVAISHLA